MYGLDGKGSQISPKGGAMLQERARTLLERLHPRVTKNKYRVLYTASTGCICSVTVFLLGGKSVCKLNHNSKTCKGKKNTLFVSYAAGRSLHNSLSIPLINCS